MIQARRKGYSFGPRILSDAVSTPRAGCGPVSPHLRAAHVLLAEVHEDHAYRLRAVGYLFEAGATCSAGPNSMPPASQRSTD